MPESLRRKSVDIHLITGNQAQRVSDVLRGNIDRWNPKARATGLRARIAILQGNLKTLEVTHPMPFQRKQLNDRIGDAQAELTYIESK